jgi:hypothetical protein
MFEQHIVARAAACALAFAALSAHAAGDAGRDANLWFGLGGGGYTGQGYDQPPGATNSDSYNVGGYAAHATLNVTFDAATLRYRHSVMFGFTQNTAEEDAILGGLPLEGSHRLWFDVGVSRLADVSNTRKAPTIGIPLELVLYPVRGLELMVHANVNHDSSFVGFAIAGAIGRHRAD